MVENKEVKLFEAGESVSLLQSQPEFSGPFYMTILTYTMQRLFAVF